MSGLCRNFRQKSVSTVFRSVSKSETGPIETGTVDIRGRTALGFSKFLMVSEISSKVPFSKRDLDVFSRLFRLFWPRYAEPRHRRPASRPGEGTRGLPRRSGGEVAGVGGLSPHWSASFGLRLRPSGMSSGGRRGMRRCPPHPPPSPWQLPRDCALSAGSRWERVGGEGGRRGGVRLG